jgi:branched-chain amino acid transport system substrate-binding protein
LYSGEHQVVEIWRKFLKRWLKHLSLISIALQIFSVISSAPSRALTEVTIAYQGPLTGGEAKTGISQFNSVRYAVEKFNSTSTSYKVQLKAIDDQGDPSVAAKLAPTTITDEKLIGLIGPAYSGASIVSLPYFIGVGLPNISPSATRNVLTDPSSASYGYPVFHRTIGLSMGEAFAKHSIKDVAGPKVYLISGDDPYASVHIPDIQDAFASLDAKLLTTQSISESTTDFSAVIAKIKVTGANTVMFLGYSQNAARFVKQLRDSGFAGVVSVANLDFLDDEDFVSLAGKAAEGTRITTNVLESMGLVSTKLEDDFKKTIGVGSSWYSIQTIDAANIMLGCISQGNVKRETLLKCIKGFKGKSLLGADISFDAYGDISGYHTYVGEFKGSQFQFTDPITNEPVVPKPTAPVESTEAQINLKSVSTRTISPGEKVSWNFEVTVQPGYIKGIYVTLIDSQGQARGFFIDGSSRFKGYVVEQAETYNTDLTLYTHASLVPGTYSIAHFCLEASKRDCVTDPKYAKAYNPSKENRSVNLDEFSFQVKDIGSNFQEKPLQISKITGKKSAYSPGEVISYEVEATGKMAFDQANMSLSFGNNSVNASCQRGYFSNCSFVQDKDKGITKVTFTFPIPEDLPAGKFEISSIYLSSSNVSISTSDTSINTTAAWTSSFSYQSNVTYGNNGLALPLDQTFDFSAYSATILDSGGVEKRPPTWNNLGWKTKKVNAGSEAFLTLDINGYHRFISGAYLYSLVSTSGNMISLKDITASLVTSDLSEGIYPLKKSGQYQIMVTIPRTTMPGSYRIGQLTVEATNCQAKNSNEYNQKLNSGTGQCSGLNSWQTTYYNGNLKALAWPGSESIATATLEVLPALKPQLPTLKTISVESNVLKIDYPYDFELSCEFSSDKGVLIHQQVSKGQSPDSINHLIIADLKPDTIVKLSGNCTGNDGLTGDLSVVEFKTAKPIPPAAPKVIPIDIGFETAKFEFIYREGFKYQVKSNSGTVTLSNGSIEFNNLSPDSKVEFQISITDSYSQTTTGDPITFSTNLPNPPKLPTLQLVSKTQTRVSLSTKFEKQNEYEVTTSSGSASISGDNITILDLKPGEKFTIVLTAQDKYGQSATIKEIFQANLPSAPRAPTLISKSIQSNELNVMVNQQAETQLFIKSSSGVVSVVGNLVKITNLAPKTTVTLTAYIVDQFGQSSTVSTKSYTTRAAAAQKSLTCTNGKTTKVVIGANPTCPAGFKKK